jgi:hypothetical protein
MTQLEPAYVVCGRSGAPLIVVYHMRRRGVWGKAVMLSIMFYVLLFVAIAQACDEHYVCEGTVARGKYWSTITPDDATEPTCAFRTTAGRKIFRECPDGTKCVVGILPPMWGDELPRVIRFKVKDAVHVERARDVADKPWYPKEPKL